MAKKYFIFIKIIEVGHFFQLEIFTGQSITIQKLNSIDLLLI